MDLDIRRLNTWKYEKSDRLFSHCRLILNMPFWNSMFRTTKVFVTFFIEMPGLWGPLVIKFPGQMLYFLNSKFGAEPCLWGCWSALIADLLSIRKMYWISSRQVTCRICAIQKFLLARMIWHRWVICMNLQVQSFHSTLCICYKLLVYHIVYSGDFWYGRICQQSIYRVRQKKVDP